MKNNLKANPFTQLIFAKSSIQVLSKHIAAFSKTQTESKRKGIELDVECLWYALEILNSYESLFSNPNKRTRKSVLDVTLLRKAIVRIVYPFRGYTSIYTCLPYKVDKYINHVLSL